MRKLDALAIQNAPVEDLALYLNALRGAGVDHELVRIDQGQPLPESLDFDLLLIGGTPVAAGSFGADADLATELRFVEEAIQAGIPTFGICCGAQILASLLGGGVERMPRMEIGCFEMELTSDGRSDSLFGGFPARFPVFHWHAEVLTPPRSSRTLVSSASWPHQAFRLDHVMGVLFHLEVGVMAARRWARAYAEELQQAGLVEGRLLDAVHRHERQMKELAATLMRNLAGLARARDAKNHRDVGHARRG